MSLPTIPVSRIVYMAGTGPLPPIPLRTISACRSVTDVAPQLTSIILNKGDTILVESERLVFDTNAYIALAKSTGKTVQITKYTGRTILDPKPSEIAAGQTAQRIPTVLFNDRFLPSFNGDLSYSVIVDQVLTVTGSLLGYVNDPCGIGQLSIELVSGPTNGTLNLNTENGSFTYTPNYFSEWESELSLSELEAVGGTDYFTIRPIRWAEVSNGPLRGKSTTIAVNVQPAAYDVDESNFDQLTFTAIETAASLNSQRVLYSDKYEYYDYEPLANFCAVLESGPSSTAQVLNVSVANQVLGTRNFTFNYTSTYSGYSRLEFTLDLGDAPYGDYTVTAWVTNGGTTYLSQSCSITKVVGALVSFPSELTLNISGSHTYTGSWPVHGCVPLPIGVPSTANWTLYEDGVRIPLQVSVVDTWSATDSNPKFLHLSFIGKWAAGVPSTYVLKKEDLPALTNGLSLTDSSTITCDNGYVKIEVNKTGFAGLSKVWYDPTGVGSYGSPIVNDSTGGPSFVDQSGYTWKACFNGTETASVVESGVNKVTIRAVGNYQTEANDQNGIGNPILKFSTYITIHAKMPHVDIKHVNTLTGDTSIYRVKNLSFDINAASFDNYEFGIDNTTISGVIPNQVVQDTPDALVAKAVAHWDFETVVEYEPNLIARYGYIEDIINDNRLVCAGVFNQNNSGVSGKGMNLTYPTSTYVTMRNNTAVGFNKVSKWAISFNFKLNNLSQANYLIGKYNQNDDIGRQFLVYVGTNGTLYYLVSGSDYTSATLTKSGITSGVWHHVVIQFEQGIGLSAYVDNVAATPVSYTKTLNESLVPLTFGSYGTNGYPNGSAGCNGVIDEVTIFHDALTVGEVATLYNSYQGGGTYPWGLSPLPSDDLSGQALIHQERHNKVRLLGATQVQDTGTLEKSDGWFSIDNNVARLSLFVEDFWEKYPHEVEIAKTGINFYSWPRDGYDTFTESEEFEPVNMSRFLCFHHGEYLDTVLPTKYIMELRNGPTKNATVDPTTDMVYLDSPHEFTVSSTRPIQFVADVMPTSTPQVDGSSTYYAGNMVSRFLATVNTSTDTWIAVYGHGVTIEGYPVTFRTSGTLPTSTPQIVEDTVYYLGNLTSTTFTVHTSSTIGNGNKIDFADGGIGIHSIYIPGFTVHTSSTINNSTKVNFTAAGTNVRVKTNKYDDETTEGGASSDIGSGGCGSKSLTSHLCLHFSDANSVIDYNIIDIFKDRPLALPSGEWNMSTNVYGENMAERDDGDFLYVEEAIDNHILSFYNPDRSQQYGKFNWGDICESWLPDFNRASLHRTWNTNHYNTIGDLWILLMRGSPNILAMTRQLMDHLQSIDMDRSSAAVFHHAAKQYMHWTTGNLGIWNHTSDHRALNRSWVIDGDWWAKDGFDLCLTTVINNQYPIISLSDGAERDTIQTIASAVEDFAYSKDMRLLPGVFSMVNQAFATTLSSMSNGPLWDIAWINRMVDILRHPTLNVASEGSYIKEGMNNLTSSYSKAGIAALIYKLTGQTSHLEEFKYTFRRFVDALLNDQTSIYHNYCSSVGASGSGWVERCWPYIVGIFKENGLTLATNEEMSPISSYILTDSRCDIGDPGGTNVYLYNPVQQDIAFSVTCSNDSVVAGIQIRDPKGAVQVSEALFHPLTLINTLAGYTYEKIFTVANAEPGLWIAHFQAGLSHSVTGHLTVNGGTKLSEACTLLNKRQVESGDRVIFAVFAYGYLMPMVDYPVTFDCVYYSYYGGRPPASITIKDSNGNTVVQKSIITGNDNEHFSFTLDPLNDNPPWSIDIPAIGSAIRMTLTTPNDEADKDLFLFGESVAVLNEIKSLRVIEYQGIKGLETWIDATDTSTLYADTSFTILASANGAVAAIKDKSGNNRHLSQSDVSMRPIRKDSVANGYTAIRFDGSNDYLGSIFDWPAPLYNSTYIAVVKTNTNISTNTIISHRHASLYWGHILYFNSSGNGVSTTSAGPTVNRTLSPSISKVTTVNAGGWCIVVSTSTVDGMKLRFNGVEYTSTDYLDDYSYVVNFRLGANQNGGAVLNGDIAEALVFSRELDSTDLAVIESYLAGRYGVTLG